MVVGVGKLLCPVLDMDRAVAFYRDGLGIPATYVSAYWSEFELGGLKIGLHPPFTAAAVAASSWIVGVQVASVTALRTRLEELGYPTSADYHEVPGGVVLDFADPDGNPLQAIQLRTTLAEITA